MSRLIAFCGLDCANCFAFIATKEDDDVKRQVTAKAWSTPEYPLTAGDIKCSSCTNKKGRHISFVKDCDIRNCGTLRKVENCAYCADYPCGRLAKSHERSPEAKKTLDDIRRQQKEPSSSRPAVCP